MDKVSHVLRNGWNWIKLKFLALWHFLFRRKSDEPEFYDPEGNILFFRGEKLV